MKRDSVVIYRDLFEGLKGVPERSYKRIMNAVLSYAMDGEEPKLSGLEYALFRQAKSAIDANNRKYENGKQGGRPKNQSEENENQSETKDEPNGNQTEIKSNLNVKCKMLNDKGEMFKEKERKKENINIKNNTQCARDVNFSQMSDAELLEFGKKPIDMSSDDAFEIINAYSEEVAKRKGEPTKWKGKIIKGNGKFEELESHDAIIQSYHFSDGVRDKVKEFLRHCALNKRLIVNDKLRDILDEICDYSEDNERIEVIDKAINGGYFDIKRSERAYDTGS